MSDDDRTIPQIDAEISHYQGKIDAITEARTPSVPDSKPTIFDHSGDAKLTSEMGKIFDKSTGKAQLADEQKTVPSVQPGDSLDSAFEKTWDHLHSTETQKATIADAHKLVEQVRANAARFGVTLTDEQAMSKAMELEYVQQQEAKAQAADPWQPAAAEIQKYYPNEQPAAIAAEYARLEGRFRGDPVAGFSEMANGIGVHPVQLAQQVIARYSQQQQPSQGDYNAVHGVVTRAFDEMPRLAELSEDVVAALKSPAFKRSGDYQRDLQWAYKQAEKQNRKLSTSDRLDRSMNAAYDRAAGRKR